MQCCFPLCNVDVGLRKDSTVSSLMCFHLKAVNPKRMGHLHLVVKGIEGIQSQCFFSYHEEWILNSYGITSGKVEMQPWCSRVLVPKRISELIPLMLAEHSKSSLLYWNWGLHSVCKAQKPWICLTSFGEFRRKWVNALAMANNEEYNTWYASHLLVFRDNRLNYILYTEYELFPVTCSLRAEGTGCQAVSWIGIFFIPLLIKLLNIER